jgi:hypothetical protein
VTFNWGWFLGFLVVALLCVAAVLVPGSLPLI